jgi:hypothetical protein
LSRFELVEISIAKDTNIDITKERGLSITITKIIQLFVTQAPPKSNNQSGTRYLSDNDKHSGL